MGHPCGFAAAPAIRDSTAVRPSHEASKRRDSGDSPKSLVRWEDEEFVNCLFTNLIRHSKRSFWASLCGYAVPSDHVSQFVTGELGSGHLEPAASC